MTTQLRVIAISMGSTVVAGTFWRASARASRGGTNGLTLHEPTTVSRPFVANARLQIPEAPPALVERPRLVTRLADSTAPMTMVIGSPGAGKTAILTEWLGRPRRAVAWLSCDPTDADPCRFWTALTLAIQRVVPDAGSDALKRIAEHGDETIDMAISLAADCEFAGSIVIVIDDFHHATPAPAIFSAFSQSLPSGSRLVLASRHDPSFPIGRLRLRGQLLELRDEDLRFTEPEAATLFASLGIEIPAHELTRLHDLTEGWVAGLQLAALAVAGRADVGALIDTFSTSDRALADLLLNEVIDTQPIDVAEFMMTTSVLETFDGTVCDAITGRDDSGDMLRRLHRDHLFLVAINSRAGWYRYHHLFAAFLRARLRATSLTRYRAAHAAAARSFAAGGDPLTAVDHALAADDVQGALELVRSLAMETLDVESHRGAIDTIRTWLHRRGNQAVADDPNMILECCVVLIALGALDSVDGWLRRVEQAPGLSDEHAAFATAVWGFLALHRGDPHATLERVAKSQAMIGGGSSEHFWVAQTPIIVCNAYLLLDDADGVQAVADAARRNSNVSPFVENVRMPGYLSWAALRRGELATAEHEATSSLDMARSLAVDERNVALVLPRLTLAAVARERDLLATASKELAVALDHADGSGRPPFRLLCLVESARLAMTEADWETALAFLERARAVMPGATTAVTDRVDRLVAAIAVSRGAPDASHMVENLLPSVDRELLRARLALADGDAQSAVQLVDATVTEHSTRRQRIEQELLLARAVLRRDRTAAVARAERALHLAEPVGMVRIVLDEGPEIHALLEAVSTDARMARFVARILDAAHRRPRAPGRTPLHADGLVEPLSEREIGVLRYLASRLTYNEIAGHLYISVNTLKSHVKAVYRKLGASTRSEAVEIARRFGLL